MDQHLRIPGLRPGRGRGGNPSCLRVEETPRRASGRRGGLPAAMGQGRADPGEIPAGRRVDRDRPPRADRVRAETSPGREIRPGTAGREDERLDLRRDHAPAPGRVGALCLSQDRRRLRQLLHLLPDPVHPRRAPQPHRGIRGRRGGFSGEHRIPRAHPDRAGFRGVRTRPHGRQIGTPETSRRARQAPRRIPHPPHVRPSASCTSIPRPSTTR